MKAAVLHLQAQARQAQARQAQARQALQVVPRQVVQALQARLQAQVAFHKIVLFTMGTWI